MYYQKFIAYIDYFERGEKVKNAGHVRIIVQGGTCSVDIRVKGLHRTDSLSVPIQLAREKGMGLPAGTGDGKELSNNRGDCMKAAQMVQAGRNTIGSLQLIQGAGSLTHTYNTDDMDGLGTALAQICGFYMPIGQDRYCSAVWSGCAYIGDRNAEADDDKEKLPEVTEACGQIGNKEAVQPARLLAQEEQSRAALDIENDTCVIKETESNTEPEKPPLSPNKWEQLRYSYQTVHPFGREDEFISIEPKDFIIMRQEYQNLVNNSFLLHGFYNYRHIILGRKKGNLQYYLGVPGTYYDREKMVAVMFGFEGFEASGEDSSDKEIEQGTFGYYMRKVDI